MKKKFTLLFGLIGSIAFSQVSPQTFTNSAVFLVPSGVTSITVEVVGAGGTGGGNGGGGGGGGGYAIGTYSVTPLSSLSIVIGTTGGSVTGISSIGISATGGADGTSVPNPTIGGGGAGGVGTGGTTANRTGGSGGGGYWTYFGGGGGGAAGATSNGFVGGNTIAWTGVCMTPGGAAGLSGGAPGGNGGKGAGFTDAACNVTDAAAIGVNYGGGGGGGNGNGGVAKAGAGGYVSISWATTNVDAINTNNLIVYPNPFMDKITIENPKGTELFELINAIGQIVWSGKNIEQHDFSDLTKGVYMMRVLDENSTQIFKLIKE
ncbi:MAG: T9SS type A sorting domain-containing protein [Bacteroidetes bacterium]|nr:T9SS type A sorting domain-containing protein [Bacteroidota bacterium]